MVGVMLIIFLLLPESPWWLAGKGRIDKAAKVLSLCNKDIEGYNVHEVIVSCKIPGTDRYADHICRM